MTLSKEGARHRVRFAYVVVALLLSDAALHFLLSSTDPPNRLLVSSFLIGLLLLCGPSEGMPRCRCHHASYLLARAASEGLCELLKEAGRESSDFDPEVPVHHVHAFHLMEVQSVHV